MKIQLIGRIVLAVCAELLANKPREREGSGRAEPESWKGTMKPQKQVPLWLRRLDLVKAEMKTVRFPKTAAEGFRQCAELSETMRRWFLDSIRQEHPGWSEEQVEQERRLLLARFSAAETRWIAKWKKERERYFRG